MSDNIPNFFFNTVVPESVKNAAKGRVHRINDEVHEPIAQVQVESKNVVVNVVENTGDSFYNFTGKPDLRHTANRSTRAKALSEMSNKTWSDPVKRAKMLHALHGRRLKQK